MSFDESSPQIMYAIGMIIFGAIRLWYTRDRTSRQTGDSKMAENILLFLVAAGMFLLPSVYLLTSFLDVADYHLPLPIVFPGALLLISSILLLWRSHVVIGTNWTPLIGLRDDHELVTTGPYRMMRHPIYAAHWIWAIAQPLLIQNWVAGMLTLLAFAPLYVQRVPREEGVLRERFGEKYVEYSERTGRIFPIFGCAKR